MSKVKGFTLIEALIAILIAAILTAIIAGGITAFSSNNQDRLLKTCLIEGAQSAFYTCRAGIDPSSYDYKCGKYKINLRVINGNCNPPSGCNNVTVRAEAQGQYFEFNDTVCNFGQ